MRNEALFLTWIHKRHLPRSPFFRYITTYGKEVSEIVRPWRPIFCALLNLQEYLRFQHTLNHSIQQLLLLPSRRAAWRCAAAKRSERVWGLGTAGPNKLMLLGSQKPCLPVCVSSQKVRLKWKELQKEHRRLILKLRHKQDGSQLCLSDNFSRMNSHDSMAGRKGQWHIRGFICHALDLWEPSKIKGFCTVFCPVLVLDDLFLICTQNGFLKRHFL